MIEKVPYFDVVIIGGSIAGNYLCYLLSHSKLKIAVIEEHKEIGLPFECAGIISKKLNKLIDLPKNIILNRVNIAKIVAPSGKYIKISGDEEPYIIDRVSLDKLFYEKVKNNENIIYFLEEKFKSFRYISENQNNIVFIETSKRNLKARMLIGCDGPLTSVGKLLGVKNKVIYATQIRIKANFSKNEALMWFDPRWKELFGWIVPEGNLVYRIGLGSSKNIAHNFNIFLKKLKIDSNKKIDQQGGIIPYGVMHKVSFNNILLLGDAAGQVKATTGGGIIMLLTAAKYAALTIQKCFTNNNFSKKFIKENYEKPCLTIIGKQLKIHYLIRTILENFDTKDFELFFHIVKNSSLEKIISLYGDMDFPKEVMLRIMKNLTFIKFLINFIKKRPSFIVKLIKIIKNLL
jgi:geranylgeranyl reductase family protein